MTGTLPLSVAKTLRCLHGDTHTSTFPPSLYPHLQLQSSSAAGAIIVIIIAIMTIMTNVKWTHHVFGAVTTAFLPETVPSITQQWEQTLCGWILVYYHTAGCYICCHWLTLHGLNPFSLIAKHRSSVQCFSHVCVKSLLPLLDKWEPYICRHFNGNSSSWNPLFCKKRKEKKEKKQILFDITNIKAQIWP